MSVVKIAGVRYRTSARHRLARLHPSRYQAFHPRSHNRRTGRYPRFWFRP